MAFRDRMRREAQPYLEPGETIQAVFVATSGIDPRLLLILLALSIPLAVVSGLPFAGLLAIVTMLARSVVIVATDRAFLLLEFSKWGRIDRGRRLARHIRLGPISGWWTKISLDRDESLYVARRFRDDVAAADAAITLPPIGVADVWPARRRARISLRRKRVA
jgi:hypothetical protein